MWSAVWRWVQRVPHWVWFAITSLLLILEVTRSRRELRNRAKALEIERAARQTDQAAERREAAITADQLRALAQADQARNQTVAALQPQVAKVEALKTAPTSAVASEFDKVFP